jgi:hypothetical protein
VGVAAISRLVGSFLFGVSPFDPLALGERYLNRIFSSVI